MAYQVPLPVLDDANRVAVSEIPIKWSNIPRRIKDGTNPRMLTYTRYLKAEIEDLRDLVQNLESVINTQNSIICSLNNEINAERKKVTHFLEEDGSDIVMCMRDPISLEAIECAVILLSDDENGIGTCGHMFSMVSIAMYDGDTCPVCRSRFTSFQRLRCVDQLIEALQEKKSKSKISKIYDAVKQCLITIF
eukprot:235641_1